MTILNNMIITIACLAIFIILMTGIFDEPAKTEEKAEEDDEILSDEEMEEILLEDGEFSYDNYDEVCCPECGEYLGIGVTKCSSCGYNNSDENQVCPNCGRQIEDKVDFCTYCDYEFDNNNEENN